jgi:YggT family protein
MFMLGHLLQGLAMVVNMVLTLYMWVIIINALLSWVTPDPRNPIVQFLHSAARPVLYQIQRRIPSVYGGIDVSPLIAMLGIYLLRHVLVASLDTVAVRLIQL